MRIPKTGPILIEGPVDLVTDNGVLHCDRFQVALCTCHRSSIYPLCDTSHRRHRHPRSEADADGSPG